jgi:hypothetical protein
MSKPVRIYDATYAEIEQLARTDRRSVANMVQLILERGLELVLSEREKVSADSRSPSTGSASSPDPGADAP